MPTPDPALQNPEYLRRVAALLSDCADAYNARLKAEAAALDSGAVYARLQEEQRLRGIANQLHFEAASRTLAEGAGQQQVLEEAIRQAGAKLAAFRSFARVVDLIGDLLALAGALVAGKPAPILAALREVRRDVRAANDAA